MALSWILKLADRFSGPARAAAAGAASFGAAAKKAAQDADRLAVAAKKAATPPRIGPLTPAQAAKRFREQNEIRTGKSYSASAE